MKPHSKTEGGIAPRVLLQTGTWCAAVLATLVCGLVVWNSVQQRLALQRLLVEVERVHSATEDATPRLAPQIQRDEARRQKQLVESIQGARWGSDLVLAMAVVLLGSQGFLLRANRWQRTARNSQAAVPRRFPQANAVLQAVVEGSPDVILVKDVEGQYVLFNSAGCRMVGKSIDEVLGKNAASLFPPEEIESIRKTDRDVMASGIARTYEERIRVGGHERTFLSTKGPVFDVDRRIVGVFGIARDITDRKEHEKEIERLNRLYAV